MEGIVRRLGYYAPTAWAPHITIAMSDLTPALVPTIQAHLAGRDFAWDLPITDIAYISEPPSGHQVAMRVPLDG